MKKNIGALILAGGKSRRMNGNNKAFLPYKDKNFLEVIREALESFENIYLSVDDKEKYKNLNYELIEDEYKGIGPISGLYSCLKNAKEDYIFVTACDMPKIKKEFIDFLCSNINEKYDALVIKDSENKIYPIGAVYSKRILPIIKNHIDKKDYKLKNLVNDINADIIPLSESMFHEDILSNINNPMEYEKLKEELKK